MKPRGPNENTNAIEVVKGGEISGSNVATSRSFTQNLGAWVRPTVKANRKPRNVPHAPTSAASNRLFPKARRLLLLLMAAISGANVKPLSSLRARPTNSARGYSTKTASNNQRAATTKRRTGSLALRHRVHAPADAIDYVALRTSATHRWTIRCRLAPAHVSSISMMFALFSTAARPGSVSTLGLAGMKLILL